MKALKTLLAIALSAGGLGTAVTLGAVANKESNSNILMVEADSNTSGSLIVKLGNAGKWSADSAKLSVCLQGESKESWTTLETISSSKALYKLDYTVNFTPDVLIVVRLNPAATSGNWSQKWNQTANLDWAEATYLQDQWDPTKAQCSQWTLSAQVRSNSVESFGTKTTLSTIGLNGSGNPEVSGAVTLVKDEEFKILSGDNKWSGYYGCPDAIDSCFSGGSKTGRSDDNPNIKCDVAGTYDFFFDTETKRVWLTRQDIVDADGYADYFLKNVGCDETGAAVPSGWSDVASHYNSLTNEAKAVLCGADADVGGDNIARCVYWYDYALNAHSGLTAFMTGRTAHSNRTISLENNNVAVIATISTILVLTATSMFFLLRKKRKEQ